MVRFKWSGGTDGICSQNRCRGETEVKEDSKKEQLKMILVTSVNLKNKIISKNEFIQE